MTTILLVPHEKYRDALLGEGPCGSRPPVAVRHETWTDLLSWVSWTPEHEWSWWHKALALKWQGTILAPGCDRAARAVPMRLPDEWSDAVLAEYLLYFRHLGEIVTLAGGEGR